MPDQAPRPLKYGWAFAIAAAVLAELLFSCRQPLHPLVLQFLVLAGLERTCAQPEPPPPRQQVEASARPDGQKEGRKRSAPATGPAAAADSGSGPAGG